MKRLAALLIVLAAPAFAGPDVPCPPASAPVADLGNVLGAAAEERIGGVCRALQEQKGVPLGVVTIPSLDGVTVETFALRLLAQWQFDAVEADGRNWEKGILLLVAPRDRKCRIELGTGWGTARSSDCRRIGDEWLYPRFRAGAYEAGIEEGVAALDAMARGTMLKAPSKKFGGVGIFVVGIALLLSIVSFVRRGTRGLAWPIWRGGFSALGWMLLILASSRGRRSRGWGHGGGGFRVGGFGGGFGGRSSRGGGFSAGGRGATGSW